MNQPLMHEPIRIDDDIHTLPSYSPVPGLGILPVNASIIRGPEPVLIDTGLAALREDFMVALDSVLPTESLQWIWITHMDQDHVGNLGAVLERAPKARIVTTYIGMAKLGLLGLPQDRVFLLNPGQELRLPNRVLACLRPPTFDAPETTALFDSRSATYFSSDAFGAPMEVPADSAAEIPPDVLRDGLATWVGIDSPWLNWVDPGAFRQSLARIRDLSPARIVSSHLPPAEGMERVLFEYLDAARSASPFVGPDQSELEAMMAA